MIGPYLQERWGVEIEMDDCENEDEIAELARQKVQKWHDAGHIQDVVTQPTQVTFSNGVDFVSSMIEGIMACQVLEKPDGLLSFEMASKQHPHIKLAYDKKFNELSGSSE